jgi:hypothetical protein
MSIIQQETNVGQKADLTQSQLLKLQNRGMQLVAKSGKRLKSLKDLEHLYYPWSDQSNPLSQMKVKADDPVLSSSTNYLTTTYGQILWNQINMEANAWGLLPKKPWDRRGWRMIKARSSTGGGIAENAALPDTDQPDLAIASHSPKTVAHTFDISYQALLESKGQDDVVGDPMATYRTYTANEHAKDMNAMLLTDADTLAGNNLESLDRLTASSAYATALSLTSADEDIFGIDKSANSWADPYTSHNSGTDRNLTLAMINQLIRETRPYWSDYSGKNCIFLTGHDTADRIAELLQAQQRFVDVNISPGSGAARQGVNTREGVEGGFNVMSYRNIPIFESIDVPQDTLSRIYLLDLGHTFIKVLAPTQYFQTGVDSGDPFILNKLNEEGMYVTIAELGCTMFKANGSVRDLQ